MIQQLTSNAMRAGRTKRVLLSLVLAAAALLACSAVALAEIKIGTDSAETLTGTHANDHLTGKGGVDHIEGLAGNDTYYFDDGFGEDYVHDLASYKVGDKSLSGGTDTLSFARYDATSEFLPDVQIMLVPAWSNRTRNWVYAGDGEEWVDLGHSVVEKAVAGPGDDELMGGAVNNTYKGGPGGDDEIYEYGGWDGDDKFSAQAPSDDVYKGFTAGPGHDSVGDWGGSTDRLDLRPLESSQVYLDAFDSDSNRTRDSLLIVIDDETSVSVYGHFAPVPEAELTNGRIEQIVFSDETVTSTAEVKALMRASSNEKGVAPASREFLETPFPEPLPAGAR